jgi:modulator of FtsH protease
MVDVAWSSWMNFYVATAGAAAALTGLVFVALSINLTRILAMPGMSARVGEAIALLGLALLVSLQSLIPGQTLGALGWEIGPIASAAWIFPLLLQWRALRRGHFRRYVHVIVRTGLHQASTLPMLVA